MAGLTSSTFPFTPLLSRPNPLPPLLVSFSSFQSHQWDLHHLLFSKSQTSLPSFTFSIFARYGAGGPSPPPSRADDFDQALDISSIKSDTVRLIDQRQNMVGLVSKNEAIRMADDAELDLVILSPDADPPVIRIMDYNKYRYEQQRKKKAQMKKSAAGRMDLKELKMGYNIDVHDYTVRLKAAHKFLKDGDKVKIIVNLKGRQNEFRNNAIELIRRFQNDIGELATEETKNFRDRNMFIILVPNKANIVQKSEEPPPKQKEEEDAPSSQVSTVL